MSANKSVLIIGHNGLIGSSLNSYLSKNNLRVDIIEEKDTLVAPNFYIDPVALAYMNGATVHYDDTGMSPTFVFNDVFKEQGGTGMCGGCGGAMGPGNYH